MSKKLKREDNPKLYDSIVNVIDGFKKIESDIEFSSGLVLCLFASIFPLLSMLLILSVVNQLTPGTEIFAVIFFLSYPSAFIAGKAFQKHIMPKIDIILSKNQYSDEFKDEE